MFQHNNPPFAKKVNCDSNPPSLPLRTMLEKRASICKVCDLNSNIVQGGGREIPLKLVKSTN